MDFKDTILQLSEKIAKQKDNISTEEATKTSFIMPMIAALGYDVFNPFEVVPEMDCDLTKKGDKIDYAIMKDDTPVLLIECKHCKQNLDLHNTQLAKYYAASNARFGVLTNGIEYRFYADLEKQNIMDEKPFLVVNMLDLSEADIEQLKKFHKSYYNEEDILSTAQELQITIQVKELLNANIQQPDDEFTRYFVRSLNGGRYSAKLVEQYRPIVKKSIVSVINDIIQDRLGVAMNSNEKAKDIEPDSKKDASGAVSDEQETPNNGIVTTEEEKTAYLIVKAIICNVIPPNRVCIRDTKNYCTVIIDDNDRKLVCRFFFNNPNNKRLVVWNKETDNWDKYPLADLDSLYDYSDILIKIAERFK